jgi:hypothetical protein
VEKRLVRTAESVGSTPGVTDSGVDLFDACLRHAIFKLAQPATEVAGYYQWSPLGPDAYVRHFWISPAAENFRDFLDGSGLVAAFCLDFDEDVNQGHCGWGDAGDSRSVAESAGTNLY